MTAKFDLSKFTQPARKMLERAQNLASTLKHQNVDVEHALVAVLEEEDNVAKKALGALDVDTKKVGRRLIEELELMPKSYKRTDQIFVSKNLLQVLEDARKESTDFNDEFVTLEHVLISISAFPKGYASKLLREQGGTPEKLREHFKKNRKGKKVTNPEGATSDILSKYAVDLTQLAANGQLQRVVGRDAELRRIM